MVGEHRARKGVVMKIRLGELRGLIREALAGVDDEQMGKSPFVRRMVDKIADVIKKGVDDPEDVELGFEEQGSSLGVVIAQVSRVDPKVSRQKSYDMLTSAVIGLVKKRGTGADSYVEEMLKQVSSGKSIRSHEEEGVFGKKAFAGPGLRKKDGSDIEPNTRVEDEVYVDLKRHFNSNVPVSDDTAKTLKGVMVRGQYGDVITPPRGEYVYRGMKANRKVVEKLIGRPLRSKEVMQGKSFSSEMVRPWKSSGLASGEGSNSWTEELNVAVGYSGPTFDGEEYSIVLVAKTSENVNRLMSGPDGLYNIYGFDTYSDEEEATSLGAIQLYKVYWKNTFEDEMGNVNESGDRFIPIELIDER